MAKLIKSEDIIAINKDKLADIISILEKINKLEQQLIEKHGIDLEFILDKEKFSNYLIKGKK